MVDHRHADVDARMDRMQQNLDGLVGYRLFDERDRVNQASHDRIEQYCKSNAEDVRELRADFEASEKDRRDNARSIRNLVLAAMFSGIVSLVVGITLVVVRG